MMQLSQIAEWLQVDLLGEDVEVTQVVTDSRCVTPGALFVAIAGPKYNGHDYLKEAKERGAVAAVVSCPSQESLTYLFVGDTLTAYARIAAFFRNNGKCPVVSLTGTCGKTTVKSMLGHVLSGFGETLMTHANHNNQIGVPQTLVRIRDKHEYAVVEVGANHVGEIEQMACVIQPDVALITNIGAGHLQGFGDVQCVMSEKASLLSHLKSTGVAVLNQDQPFFNDLLKRLKHQQPVISFGLSNDAVVRAEDVSLDDSGCAQYNLMIHQKIHSRVILPLLGRHQVMNSLATIAVCLALDLHLSQVVESLKTLPQVPGRMSPYKLRSGALVIDDSYNANPDSFEAALDVLANCPQPQILVMGDMVELGEDAQRFHQKVGLRAKELGIQKILAHGPGSAESVRMFGAEGEIFESHEMLLNRLDALVHNKVSVLIKGSHSSQMHAVAASVLHEETEAYA